jgi:hypothetical protein
MPKNLSIWPEADVKLRKRWAAGVPCAQIGRELGVSAAAVIGRADRIGLGRHPSRANRKPRTPRTFIMWVTRGGSV